MAKKLMKGSEAIGEAAIQAGCRYFFGYPITPQNEIPEYMSRRLPVVSCRQKAKWQQLIWFTVRREPERAL